MDKQAETQLEQEPDYWIGYSPYEGGTWLIEHKEPSKDRMIQYEFEPVYTAPPKREWSDISDAQLIDEVRRRGFVIRDAQVGSRECQRLTDEQISLMAHNDDPCDWNDLNYRICWHVGYLAGARAIEDTLKSKNNG